MKHRAPDRGPATTLQQPLVGAPPRFYEAATTGSARFATACRASAVVLERQGHHESAAELLALAESTSRRVHKSGPPSPPARRSADSTPPPGPFTPEI